MFGYRPLVSNLVNLMFSLRLGTKANAKFFNFVYMLSTWCAPKGRRTTGPKPYTTGGAKRCWSCATLHTTQVTLADAPPARKEAACASFDSFMKLMCKALAYLDRSYVPRLSLATVQQVAAPEKAALRQAGLRSAFREGRCTRPGRCMHADMHTSRSVRVDGIKTRI